MKFDLNRHNARMELRIMELEDSVAALSRIIGTMTEMLGGLNRIAAHYADTVTGMLPIPVPHHVRPPAVTMVPGEPGAGSCGGACACAARDVPEDE